MELSVVFSFRNESLNIPELIRRVSRTLEPILQNRYEIVFVNDDSSDGSLELLLSLINQYPLVIVNMSRRFGVTPCVLAGLKCARGRAVVYLDSDLQDPPELISQLYAKYLDGFDVIHTRRVARLGESRFKMLFTKIAYRVINFFSEIDLPTNVGDFKLLSRRVVDRILELEEYDPYMRGLSVWVGYRQCFVNYVRESRHQGESQMPLLGKGPIKEFVRGLTAYSAGPLYMSIFLGLGSILIAAILVIYGLGIKILGLSAPGISGITIMIAFFSGVILFTNGILGLYISRIYYESKKRPRYIVESIMRSNHEN